MPKSPDKSEKKCRGCDYVGKALRSHLSKSTKCTTFYDMDALYAEAKVLHKTQMAARNRDQYHNVKKTNDNVCHLCTKVFATQKSMDRHIDQIHLGN